MIGLMATSKTVYMKGAFQECYCRCPHPCDEPLLTLASTGDPAILASGSVSCGVTAPFLWVLVPTDFVCALQDWSLFHPVLWNSCNQIPLAFKVRFPRGPQSLCQIPRLGSLMWGSEPSQQWEDFFGILCSSLWVTHTAGKGSDLVVIVPSYPLIAASSLSLEAGYLFDGFQHPPVDGRSTDSCDFGALTEGEECLSFYATVLTQKPSHHNFKRSKNKYTCTYIHKRSALHKSWWGKKERGTGVVK